MKESNKFGSYICSLGFKVQNREQILTLDALGDETVQVMTNDEK